MTCNSGCSTRLTLPVLASNATTLSIGKDSGTSGEGNLFVGQSAGQASTTGRLNTFIGQSAGLSNTDGSFNTFMGNRTGASNTTGCCNNFFGNSAGMANTIGQANSFFGGSAGLNNTTGGSNAFFGNRTGENNTTGIGNSFFGAHAGLANTVGNNNTALGYFADVGAGNLTFATAIGAGAVVSTSNTQAGAALTATSTGSVLFRGGPMQSGNHAAQTFDLGNFRGLWGHTLFLGANGGFDTILASPVHVCARVESLGGGFGGYALVRCTSSFSSANNKTDLQTFSDGINIIKRLNPVAFKWKADGKNDVGLNAEEVAEVEPLLVTRNDKGDVEDGKEASLQVVFINAIKELEGQIKRQQHKSN